MEHVHQAIEDFLNHCKFEKKLSDKTLKAYGIDLQQFLMYLNDNTDIADIRAIDKHVLSKYLDVIYEKGKPKTIKRKIATLRAFFNYLEFEDRVVVSPFRKMQVKVEQDETTPEILTPLEIEALLTHVYKLREASRYQSEIRQKALIRDIAILELLLESGMRVSELCNLEVTHVDLQENKIRIAGKGLRERTIPMVGEAAIRAMQAYERTHASALESSEFWFLNRDSKKISDQSVRALISKYSQGAGIQKNVTPHTFRHTLATMLLESGWDIRAIQYFLGHSTITTPQIYIKVSEETQRSFLEGNHPRQKIQINRPQIKL